MPTLPIDEATLLDALALNNEHAVELSAKDEIAFRHLLERAFYARWTAGREAFLLAFAEDADYANEHLLWFRPRYPRFVYVDRVVVRREHRRRGLARLLYADLFRAAREAGQGTVVCEVNLDPPNPASDAFHAALGFREVGLARSLASGKTVRYFAHVETSS